MAAHRYWRVNNIEGYPPYYSAAWAEIELAATPGGANQCVGGVAAASSSLGGYPPANAFDGNYGTFWITGGPLAQWISYDFGTPVEVEEMRLFARNDGISRDAAKTFSLQYSDDDENYFDHIYVANQPDWTNGEQRDFTFDPTPSDEINVAQGGTMAIFHMAAETVVVPQAGSFAVYGIPAEAIKATYAGEDIVYGRISQKLKVEQAGMLAIIRGRVANPRVRAWTFTLDGHDFYVLRLGDDVSLLYDVSSERWIEWTYADEQVWRPNTGMTWIGGQRLAQTYGSGIVVGDDTFGLLWFLDPKAAFDEHPDEQNHLQQIPFPRIVSAQALATGRDNQPCYAIFVDGDNYGLTADDFVPNIVLETSDDQGRTFYAHDTLNVTLDPTDSNPYSWYSLGQISSPGRIFRITDNGVFTRIDTMEMNDDAG